MNKQEKIAQYVERKILSPHIFISILLLILGITVFLFMLENKIEGTPALFLYTICYLSLGIGLYSILKWGVIQTFKALIFTIKFIITGKLEMIVDKKGLHTKLHLN